MKKPFRCKLGLHKLGRAKFHMIANSNVKDYERVCSLCGYKKTWVKERGPPED